MDDQQETMTFGSLPSPRRRGLPGSWRLGVSLFVVFVLGIAVGTSGLVPARPGEQGRLALTVSTIRAWTGSSDGRVSLELDVVNHGSQSVRIDRISAETTGYSLHSAGPMAGKGERTLNVAPGASGRVGVLLRPWCASQQAPAVKLLVMVGGHDGDRAVELSVPGSRRALVRGRREFCQISDRPSDYPVQLSGWAVPEWANGRVLVLKLWLQAQGRFASGLELAQFRAHIPGVVGHFHTDRPSRDLNKGVDGKLLLRLTNCAAATGAGWQQSGNDSKGATLAMLVEKPSRASEVQLGHNPTVVKRIRDWLAVACREQAT